jgi:predicted Fe-S protein YdhL (DUF1289 family)
MKRFRQTIGWPALFAAGHFLIFPLSAQDSTVSASPAKLFPKSTNSVPSWRNGKSPVDFFRQLLAMTPDERDDFLTNRPPEIHARILAKVAEYEALGPNERELRLRATELRWYLMPLLRESPTNRTAQLAQVPDDVRELVESRLEEWTIVPPTLQQEFLENEHILQYFAHLDMSNSPSEMFSRTPSAMERAHWNELSEPERRQVMGGFNQFFDLTPDEKEKALNTLSETERRQMEKTLQSFEKMPPSQRDECVNAFARFASMTAPEQAEFLKNAERWSAMSPAERQAWRDLVVNVPQWPPLPIGFVVPIPGESKPGVATNRN